MRGRLLERAHAWRSGQVPGRPPPTECTGCRGRGEGGGAPSSRTWPAAPPRCGRVAPTVSAPAALHPQHPSTPLTLPQPPHAPRLAPHTPEGPPDCPPKALVPRAMKRACASPPPARAGAALVALATRSGAGCFLGAGTLWARGACPPGLLQPTAPCRQWSPPPKWGGARARPSARAAWGWGWPGWEQA